MLVWFSPAYSPMADTSTVAVLAWALPRSNIPRGWLQAGALLSPPEITMNWAECRLYFQLELRKTLMDLIKLSIMTRFEALSVERASSQNHFASLSSHPKYWVTKVGRERGRAGVFRIWTQMHEMGVAPEPFSRLQRPPPPQSKEA